MGRTTHEGAPADATGRSDFSESHKFGIISAASEEGDSLRVGTVQVGCDDAWESVSERAINVALRWRVR